MEGVGPALVADPCARCPGSARVLVGPTRGEAVAALVDAARPATSCSPSVPATSRPSRPLLVEALHARTGREPR